MLQAMLWVVISDCYISQMETPDGAVDILHAKEPGCRTYVQTILSPDQPIVHENRILVQKSHKNRQELQIRNYLATNKEGKLVKVTEILIQDRIIQITDVLSPLTPLEPSAQILDCPQPLYKTQTSTFQKKQSAAKLPRFRQHQLRRSSQATKNILKIFQAWILKNDSKPLHLHNEVVQLIKKHQNLNQSLRAKLAEDINLRKMFMRFCEAREEEIIGVSRLDHKASHLQELWKWSRVCSQQLGGQERRNIVQKNEERESKKKDVAPF